MTYVTPLQPVSEAVFGVLQDATLLALLPGGAETDLPDSPTFPFLWIEINETRQRGGFGSKPGTGTLPEIEIRLHVYSQFAGQSEAHAIVTRAITVLSVAGALSVTGYRVCSTEPFHDSTLSVGAQTLNNIPVWEFVSSHRLYVEAL